MPNVYVGWVWVGVGGGMGVGCMGVCTCECACNCSLPRTLVCGGVCVGGGVWGGGVCVCVCVGVFCNTTVDTIQLGTFPVVETSMTPMAKKRKNALFQPGDVTQVHGDVLG